MPANNMVVIPNSRLSQNVVVNYSLPEKRTSLAIPVCVSCASDPDMVEGILVDEMQKAVKELAEVLDNPEPMVRFSCPDMAKHPLSSPYPARCGSLLTRHGCSLNCGREFFTG